MSDFVIPSTPLNDPNVFESLLAEARSRAAPTEPSPRSTAFRLMLQEVMQQRSAQAATPTTLPVLDRELVFDLALRNPTIARALQHWHRKELTWEQVTYFIIWSLVHEQQTLITQILALHNHLPPPVLLPQDLQNGSDPSRRNTTDSINGLHPARRAGDASSGV